MHRRWTLPLLTVAVFLAHARAVQAQDKEPSYEGIALSEWTRRLSDPSVRVRADAVEALARSIGPEGRSAVPVLVAALKDKQASNRFFAAEALGRLGAEAKPAIPALLRALKDEDAIVRRDAADALARIGAPALQPLIDAYKEDVPANHLVRTGVLIALPGLNVDAKLVLPTLTEAVTLDANAEAREWAAHGLSKLGGKAKSAVPALCMALKDRHSPTRGQAVLALLKMGPDALAAVPTLLVHKDESTQIDIVVDDVLAAIGPAAVPALVKGLDDPATRKRSMRALARIGPPAETVPVLIVALPDGESCNFDAARALQKIGKPAWPALLKAMTAGNPNVRAGAMLAVGPDFKEAVPALTANLDSRDRMVREMAMHALGGIGADAKSAIPALIGLLKTGADEDRLDATLTLGQIGKPAVPALIDALKDQDLSVRIGAARALSMESVGADVAPAVPQLLAAMKDPDPRLRSHAVWALGNCKAAVVPTLIGALKDSDVRVREAAVNVLRNFGADKKAIMPPLLETLKDQARYVRVSAAHSLILLDADAKTLLPALLDVLRNVDFNSRQSLPESMAKLGKPAVPMLTVALQDKDGEVRAGAARALGFIGAEAKPALPQLVAALKDNYPPVRMAAARALAELGLEAKKNAVPILVAAIPTAQGELHAAFVQALQRLDPQAAKKLGYPEWHRAW